MANEKIKSIQVLRGVAALGVVAFHTSGPIISAGWHAHAFQALSRYGLAGVDIFFVISGFVMATVTNGKEPGIATAARFAAARVRRIVPLYWLLTALMLLCMSALPAIFERGTSAWHIAASLLFLPARDPSGLIAPVLNVGWTLNYEMLFYALFAIALTVTRYRLTLVSVVLAIAASLSLWKGDGVPHAFYTNPTVLEFSYGCLLGYLTAKGHRLSPLVGGALIAVALVVPFALGIKMMDANRFIVFGLPALTLVATAVALETRLAWPKLLQALGDASYSLYLTHIFTIPLAVSLISMLDVRRTIPGNVVCELVLLAAVVAGVVTYRYIEKGILPSRWLSWRGAADSNNRRVAPRA